MSRREHHSGGARCCPRAMEWAISVASGLTPRRHSQDTHPLRHQTTRRGRAQCANWGWGALCELRVVLFFRRVLLAANARQELFPRMHSHNGLRPGVTVFGQKAPHRGLSPRDKMTSFTEDGVRWRNKKMSLCLRHSCGGLRGAQSSPAGGLWYSQCERPLHSGVRAAGGRGPGLPAAGAPGRSLLNAGAPARSAPRERGFCSSSSRDEALVHTPAADRLRVAMFSAVSR